ncbi:MAG: hypothetical protein ACI9R3_000515 [Verrucomicrobiales bacterium]|jgi:hypothetical protein
MKILLLILGLMFSATSGQAEVSQRQFHRIYQPYVSSAGGLGVTGKWHEIPSAQVDNPRTWVAPFLQSGSHLMPKNSVTSRAGIEVTSVMGIANPLVSIHVSGKHSLKGPTRSAVLQRLIECIQLNMKDGAFINVKVSVDEGVVAKEFEQFEGSYTTLREKPSLASNSRKIS